MIDEFQQLFNRRAMIGRGSAMLGACLLGTATFPANAEVSNLKGDDIIDVKKFGATGKREQNATKSFKDAIEACVKRGGGTVNVSPGEYTIGTIQLTDNINLHIEAGATLFLSQLQEEFRQGSKAMIFAENAKNISVTGKGTLDGLAQYDYAEMRGLDVDISKEIEMARAAGVDMRRYYRKATALNAYMFIINDCTNVLLSDISIINSPLWTVKFSDCDRVSVRGVYIYSDLEKGVNADGIDICSSRNIIISDSTIITADDSIVLKTPARNDRNANPCENITVTNCILSSSSTALMIGTETHADINNVLFNNCVIRNSNKGFGINVQDGATVRNVIFSNLTIETNRRHWNWWGSAEMCKFILLKRTPDSRAGVIKDILVENVIAQIRGTSTVVSTLDQPIENISFSNVQIMMNPEDAKDKRASHGMVIEGVKGLKMHNFSVNWVDETEKKWQSALTLKNVSDFVIDSFAGRQGLKDSASPVILLDNSTDGIIRESRAIEGARTFVHVQGNESANIILRNNKIGKAKEVTFENDALKKVIM